MSDTLKTATGAVKSAFSVKMVLQWIALYFLFNLLVSLAVKLFPNSPFVAKVYRFITNPLSFFNAPAE